MVEVSTGKVEVRRFVFEHAEIFRTFMRDCWMAGLTISGIKSAIVMKGIEIVGFLCDAAAESEESRGHIGLADTQEHEGSEGVHWDCSLLSDIYFPILDHCGAHLFTISKWEEI